MGRYCSFFLWLLTSFAVVVSASAEVPAEVTDLWISPSTVLEHETFVISCTVEGDPEPTVAISNTYTGIVVYINVTTGTVNATVKAEWFDSVAWRCAASNVLTNGTRYVASTNATVAVHFSPRPDHAQEYNVTAGIGEFAPLMMAYIANPAPNVTWTHDGDVIPETTAGGGTPYGFSMLNVSDIEVWDFLSDYEITMDNGVGPSYTATYRIIPHGPPETPTNVEAYNVTNTSVTVQWRSGYDMGKHQQFLLMDRRPDGTTFIQWSQYIQDTSDTHGINQTWTYTRDNLHPGTEYVVSALAQNDDGYSKLADPPVTFKTTGSSPEPESSDTNVAIIVGPAVGGACLLVLVLAILFYYRHRRRVSYIKK